jgi:hypothetical protein
MMAPFVGAAHYGSPRPGLRLTMAHRGTSGASNTSVWVPLGAEASGSHQVVTADGASGREGQPVHAAKSRSWLGKVFGFNPAALNWPHAVLFLDVALVPLVIFWAVGHEEYLLSALFGVLFTMLADPGGSYGHRASHTAVFGLIGAGVTALGRRENRERSCYHAASVEVTVRVWSAKLATSSRCPPSAWT